MRAWQGKAGPRTCAGSVGNTWASTQPAALPGQPPAALGKEHMQEKGEAAHRGGPTRRHTRLVERARGSHTGATQSPRACPFLVSRLVTYGHSIAGSSHMPSPTAPILSHC